MRGFRVWLDHALLMFAAARRAPWLALASFIEQTNKKFIITHKLLNI
jgi:hypothetical protein